MKNLIPSVGVRVPFTDGQVILSKDQITYMCRITYDESTEDWVIASVLNPGQKYWTPITKSRRIGLVVFLNDKPHPSDTHIEITAIQPTGKGAYADPVSADQHIISSD